MFEIGVLEFYHLHKIAKDKLKVLAGLYHVVHFLTNHLETFAMRYYLGHLFLSIKSNCEVSTLLLLCDVSLKLCAVDLFSNRPTTSLSSSFVFLSFPVFGLNPSPKITPLAKNRSTHPLQNSISYLQYSSNLSTFLHSPTSHHPTTRVYSPIIISFLVSPSSLILFEVLQPLLCLYVYAAPAFWNGLPKDLRQFANPPNPPLNFTYPPLALSSATFHSRLKTELFKISYPGSTPAPRHICHHHLLQP